MKRTATQLYRFKPVPGVDFIDPKDGTPAKAHTCYITATQHKDGTVTTRNHTEGGASGHFDTKHDWLNFLDRAQLSYIIEELNVLHLVLKHRWYTSIESDGKREEYRNPTEYWTKRLTKNTHTEVSHIILHWRTEPLDFKHYDLVTFHDGYTSRTQTWTVTDITLGKGSPAWGAPEHQVFIIKLGERVDTHNKNEEKTL